MNLPTVLSEIFTEVKAVMSTLLPDLLKWAQEVVAANDPVKQLTGGALNTVSQPWTAGKMISHFKFRLDHFWR